jgi:hypothetical protein
LACGVCLWPERSRQAAAQDEPARPKVDPALAGSTITALLDANGGKPPPTGKDLWQVLTKLDLFAQLPVVFSAVRLDSGVANPRVVITPLVSGLSHADATAPNFNGRLYLAANMQKDSNGGDPHVASVEFISWNALRRKFDFGVIEDMGTDSPQLRVVDGGKCFACHKNKGPILGTAPWTNTTHHSGFRTLVSAKFNLPAALPAGGAGAGMRDRIDGMALAAPQAQVVDDVVRLGALLRLQRETFRLMNRYDGGRKAVVAMLVAAARPGQLNPNDRQAKFVTDQWGNDESYLRFAKEWVSLARSTSTGILIDFAPIPKPLYEWAGQQAQPLPTPPPGGFTSLRAAQSYERRLETALRSQQLQAAQKVSKLQQLATLDAVRATGQHGMPSAAQPSNPKAFVQPPTKVTQRPSGMVNPLMLANTIGLTEGDRKFMADALAGAARRLGKQKATPAGLAKEVFEGPEFADVLKGGPLPDRDDFKDRFVAGLDALLTTKYKLATGFAPERESYASGPRRDPKLVDELEAAVVPTTACLRCHDVRDGTKPRLFEPIPALAFDPLDKQARERWAQAANPKRKQEVLARLLERLVTDADMPPHDSPEHELFRVKQAAAFDDLKQFLESQVEAPEKPKKP